MTELTSAGLTTQIQSAMKAGDKQLVDVLRLLSASIKNAEVAAGGPLPGDDAVAVVAREVRKREEAAVEYEKAGKSDRAQAERDEAEILKRYLPEQLSAEELAAAVDEAIASAGATGPEHMGAVMKFLMPKVKGKADGRAVSDLVKQRLGA